MLKINKINQRKSKNTIPDNHLKNLKKEGIMELFEWTENLQLKIFDAIEKISGKEIMINRTGKPELTLVPVVLSRFKYE